MAFLIRHIGTFWQTSYPKAVLFVIINVRNHGKPADICIQGFFSPPEVRNQMKSKMSFTLLQYSSLLNDNIITEIVPPSQEIRIYKHSKFALLFSQSPRQEWQPNSALVTLGTPKAPGYQELLLPKDKDETNVCCICSQESHGTTSGILDLELSWNQIWKGAQPGLLRCQVLCFCLIINLQGVNLVEQFLMLSANENHMGNMKKYRCPGSDQDQLNQNLWLSLYPKSAPKYF